ncbi:adenylate/guanylate cyclase domain-containing protein [Gillisia hiemivivida]|uniref:Tetratricopeptide repeat protein n=1 Tax=Gillisia hiemivivida TaxID=291190 RepID=A0A5C6ZXM9_9FLAO|nr:adenylate/guanylate cyclase domain-containing protein [Gillisia hiemivivida]TXD94102.1 tetratricopeptide repeat protein [Gillisia hiemivivida]
MIIGVSKKLLFLIGLFQIVFNPLFGQNQKLADSLVSVYDGSTFNGDPLPLLKEIAENQTDPDDILHYSELLIKNARKDSLVNTLLSGYLLKGHAFKKKGDNTQALKAYFKSLEYANLINDNKGKGSIIISVADTYSEMENHNNAERYYQQGIEILRLVNDSINLASALLNAGDEFFNSKKYDKALAYFEESGYIFEAIDYPIGKAYNLGNVGMVYAEQRKDKLAEENIDAAISILEELKDYYPISVYLTYMSDIYSRQNDYKSAFAYANRSLELALAYNLKSQISDAYLQLASLSNMTGDFKGAYDKFKLHISYRDSVVNISSVQQMAELRTNYELSQKQTELDLLAQQKKTQQIIFVATSIALFFIILLAIGLYRRNRFIKRTSNIIEVEKGRSDELLLNILPEETAQELKDFGKVKSRRFESVTVLFTDFKNFTQVSENMSPEAIVESVDFYFSKFDEIIEKYELEKIKTIGDSYMCAGGLPFPLEDHAFKILLAALEIAEFVKANSFNDSQYKIPFEVRIGVNTGAVVAGVVGKKKFAYDVWGDTVNIASRMESSSESGFINISENTYQLVKDYFDCEYRGEIQVKNRGMMKMYYVLSLKDHLNLINTLEGYEVSGINNKT